MPKFKIEFFTLFHQANDYSDVMSSEHINLYTLIAITAFILLTLGRVLWLYFGFWKKDIKPTKYTNTERDIKEVTISHPIISKLYDQYSETMIGQNHVFV
jgi:hypothetical protein